MGNRLDRRGFTLLEVMIAMAIMVVAFASILMVQSNSLESAAKARQMNVVGMLAKGLMVKTELEIEGKTFSEVKKEDAGQFEDPYQDYKWAREIKEVTFPNLNLSGVGPGADSSGGAAGSGTTDMTDKLTKLMTKHLSKAIREVKITVSWKRGKGEQHYNLSTYWVDLNHEFSVTE